MSQSLKFFNTINSFRSNPNSLDESISIIQNSHGNTESSKHNQQWKKIILFKNIKTTSLLSADSLNDSLTQIVIKKLFKNWIKIRPNVEFLFFYILKFLS